MMRHSMIVTDRGLGHRHRWSVSCSCGWFGRHHRQQRFAGVEYRGHVRHVEGQTKRTVRKWNQGRRVNKIGVQPRPVTPIEKLPEILR